MSLEYITFDQVSAAHWLPILNKPIMRQHLVHHDLFTPDTINTWVEQKLAVDASEGCKVRAIKNNGVLIGWCGIQFEEYSLNQKGYDIAIIIDEDSWGLGKTIFKDAMGWAKELGHKVVLIHLLNTRREYAFLRKRAKRVYSSKLLGGEFTTYELEVKKFL